MATFSNQDRRLEVQEDRQSLPYPSEPSRGPELVCLESIGVNGDKSHLSSQEIGSSQDIIWTCSITESFKGDAMRGQVFLGALG